MTVGLYGWEEGTFGRVENLITSNGGKVVTLLSDNRSRNARLL
jgi:hypothetical protein